MNLAERYTPSGPPPRTRQINVVQGEFAVVSEPDTLLSTILGSCVAACIRDPVARVGGMNHFLLPGDDSKTSESLKYGVNSMELLINGLLRLGASRGRLEAKLFGGAQVVKNLSDIGTKNAEFAQKFLRAEGINCVGQSLGGERARRLRYWPDTGRASQLFVDPRVAGVLRPEGTPLPSGPKPESGTLELF